MRPSTFISPLLIAAMLCPALRAQTAADDEEPQQAPILQRLSEPSSAITVYAPGRLLERALPVAGEPADQTDNEGADGEETEKTATHNKQRGKTAGYRVQVYADNNARSAKTEARHRERAISQAFPAYDTYVSYASPYWRLRVGDFRSTYEAEKAAAEIRRAFPRYAREVRVVRDHVTLR